VNLVHICRATGPYIGQVRWYGHRKWLTVTGRCKTWQGAAAIAIKKMDHNDKRMRVLMLDDWNEPIIVMEASK